MSVATSSIGGTVNNCIPPQNSSSSSSSSSSSCTGPDFIGACSEWPPSMNPWDSFYPYPGMPSQGPQPPPSTNGSKTLK